MKLLYMTLPTVSKYGWRFLLALLSFLCVIQKSQAQGALHIYRQTRVWNFKYSKNFCWALTVFLTVLAALRSHKVLACSASAALQLFLLKWRLNLGQLSLSAILPFLPKILYKDWHKMLRTAIFSGFFIGNLYFIHVLSICKYMCREVGVLGWIRTGLV